MPEIPTSVAGAFAAERVPSRRTLICLGADVSSVAPIGSRTALADIGLELLRAHFPPALGVRLLGVTISNSDTTEAKGRAQLALIL